MGFLELRGLSKTYEVVERAPIWRRPRTELEPALVDLDLDLERGEVLSVMGPSGCGKTTMLRLIAGLEQADSGSIHLDGRDLARVPTERRSVGLVFQNLSLFPHYDVAGNIGYGLRDEKKDRVDELLSLVGLEGYGQRRIQTLSGGERQRVALARALAPGPEVLLLDEPLTSLDRLLRVELAAELRDLLHAAGVAVIHVTHDQEEAFTIGDRVLLLMDGKKVQEGTPRQVHDEPVSPEAARFLGHENLFELEDDFPLWKDFSGGGTVLVPDSAIVIGEGPLEAVVRAASFRGAQTLYRLDLDGLELLWRGKTNLSLEVGDQISIRLLPDSCRYWSR